MAQKGEYKYRIDLTGNRYGKLTVIEYAGYTVGERQANHLWKCKCDCGTTKIIPGRMLREGNATSCGCPIENIKQSHINHRKSQSNLYRRWRGIKSRCYNPNNSAYKYYGGRGIKMCEEWKNDFMAFCIWAYNNGYDESKGRNCSIDRIDVNGNYTPDNCRFADTITQANNTRRTRRFPLYGEMLTRREASEKYGVDFHLLVTRMARGLTLQEAVEYTDFDNNVIKHFATINGETKTISEWCKIYDLKYTNVLARINRNNLTPEEALFFTDTRTKKYITINGVTKKITDWGKEYNISYQTVKRRLNMGWSDIDAITKPVMKKNHDKIL